MYDDIESAADGYLNNAFVELGKAIQLEKKKVCNWADYEFP